MISHVERFERAIVEEIDSRFALVNLLKRRAEDMFPNGVESLPYTLPDLIRQCRSRLSDALDQDDHGGVPGDGARLMYDLNLLDAAVESVLGRCKAQGTVILSSHHYG